MRCLFHIIYIYSGWMKNACLNQHKVYLHHNFKKNEHMPSKAWCPYHGLLMIKESEWSVYLEFSCCQCRTQTSGILLSSTTSDWGCLPLFPMTHPSRAVKRCGSADWNPFMVHAWCCSTTFFSCIFGIFGHCCSRTVGRMQWTNSMDCLFCFKTLRFSLSLCWRSQQCPGLATMKHSEFEMICTTPEIFRVTQSLFRHAIFCIGTQGQEAITWKPCFKWPVYIKHSLLVFRCKFTIYKFGHALFILE